MALISMRQMLDHAAEYGYGVPAFNVNNLEQMRAIMEAADQTDSPVIVQASAGARKYAGAPFLRHLILAATEEFPHIPVVMHQDHGTSPSVCQRSIQLGFSSVPQEWLAIINEFGGEIPETYGVPVEQICEGIKYGVRKVNIDTDLRLASTGAVRRFLAENPAEFDPRKYLKETVTAMKEIVVARYEAFGTAGNASKIKPLSLEVMFERYEAGELNPVVS